MFLTVCLRFLHSQNITTNHCQSYPPIYLTTANASSQHTSASVSGTTAILDPFLPRYSNKKQRCRPTLLSRIFIPKSYLHHLPEKNNSKCPTAYNLSRPIQIAILIHKTTNIHQHFFPHSFPYSFSMAPILAIPPATATSSMKAELVLIAVFPPIYITLVFAFSFFLKKIEQIYLFPSPSLQTPRDDQWTDI